MSCIASRKSVAFVSFLVAAAGLGCDQPVAPPKPIDPYSEAGLKAHYGFELGADIGNIAYYKRELDKKPCNVGIGVKLADELLRNKAHEATIKHVDDYLASCPASLNIMWKRFAANQKLERWDAALADADALVRERPGDKDFWWWRGEIHEAMGDYAQALVDYQQTLAINDQSVAAGRGLLTVSRKTRALNCPIAFAVQRYAAASNNPHSGWKSRIRELYIAGQCDREAGRGNLHLGDDRDAPVTQFAVELGPQKADFPLNPTLGVTVLDAVFAASAGIAIEGPEVQVYVNGQHLFGTLVVMPRLTLGLVHVSKLPVVVVAEIPGGASGILGADFMWRFNQDWSEDGLALSSWVAPGTPETEAQPADEPRRARLPERPIADRLY